MSWFKYLKTQSATEYTYPVLRRRISKFTPNDNISAGTWLFVDVSQYNISSYYDSSLESNEDDYSYVVVYENVRSGDYFVPVKTVINEGIAYFQAAVDHQADQEIEYQYVLYYKAPNIRKIKSFDNNGTVDYYINTPEDSDVYIDFDNVDVNSFSVDLNSTSYYNFSFINSGTNWYNGETEKNDSIVYAIFSGPSIKVVGSKGPDFGFFKYEIVPINIDANDLRNYSPITIDAYSKDKSDNFAFIDRDDLSYRDYRLKITTDSRKNVLSSGNRFKINSYQFSYNPYVTLGDQELSDQITFVSISGVR